MYIIVNSIPIAIVDVVVVIVDVVCKLLYVS